MKRPFFAWGLGLALAFAALAGCRSKEAGLENISRLEDYSFDAGSALESRVARPSDGMLAYISQADGRKDYAAYDPSAADKALVMDYLRLLPKAYEKVFKERCIGVYFVSNLQGNGFTSWVLGPGGKIYFYIILNPASLKAGLSETLTERERSCFIPEPGWSVSVDAGKKYKGLLYALFHEGTHGLDYAMELTPYTDNTMPQLYRPLVPVSGSFFRKTWEDYSKPLAASDFPGRNKLTFYGFGGGPKLPISKAPALYKSLTQGDFASLYGARSWSEDFAELITFQVLTAKLGQPYVITIAGPGGKLAFQPMRGKAGKRAAEAEEFVEKL